MQYNQDNISLLLAQRLSDKVNTTWECGEMLEAVTPVTRELLQYWFCEPFTQERTVNFHTGQRQAILNTIYLHEVVGIHSVEDSYAEVMEGEMGQVDMATLAQEKYRLPKYAVKMATGTGKTWVMHALVLWQLLNARHPGSADALVRYTQKFLLIAPGIIVYERLLDAYLGKVENGERKVESSDLHRYQDLFLPPQYCEEVFNFVQTNTVSKESIGRKVTGEGMIAITNWHLFLQRDDEEKDLVDELLPLRPGIAAGNALDVLDRRYLRGTEAEYLHDLDSLMIINDEAHHVHENGGDEDDVQWQQALDYMLQGKQCRVQVDFSATPFEQRGSGRRARKVYFPHIVVDFDLKQAMLYGLVKTLMLDQRQNLTELETLDYNAIRDGRNVISLSDGQRLMLRAGLTKLNLLQEGLNQFGQNRYAKMLVVCEDTKVTPFVVDYLKMEGLKEEEVLRVDSDAKGNMKEEEWHRVSERLSNMDHHAKPRVIVSVMMLREGFDVNNICVIVPLRSSTSSILLEQTVGRGLRLMWREVEYKEAKEENRRRVLVEKKEPSNYLDMLFVVEHPRFREFYEEMISDGLMGVDDGSGTTTTLGDIVMSELKEDYQRFDLTWLTILRESEEVLQLPPIDTSRMESFMAYTLEQLRRYLAHDGESFVSQAAISKTQFGKYTVKANLFTAESYHEYLLKVLHMVTRFYDAQRPMLQVSEAMLMQTLDRYIRTRLFGQEFDPFHSNDWKILLAQNGVVTQHIVKVMATALYTLQQQVQATEAVVEETRFSSVEKIPVRELYSLELRKTIYTRTPFPSHGGGLERAFMEFIDCDSQVERWIKISETRHRFAIITYMRADGLLATYHPDFLVATADKVYMVETKGQDRVMDRNVRQKRRAAVEWCDKLNDLPPATRDGREWEYILIGENDFYGLSRNGATFEDICQRCRINAAVVQGELQFDI